MLEPLLLLTALRAVAAVLALCVLPGMAVACWLGMPLRWRDAQAWVAVLVGGATFVPLVIFSNASRFGVAPAALAAPVLFLTLLLALTAPRAPHRAGPH